MASSINVEKEQSVSSAESVNDGAYLGLHSGQIFEQGLSFSGNERDKLWINTGADGFADLSDLSGADSPNDGRAVLATDFDDDGDLDLFVHNVQRERHNLYRNDIGTGAGYIKVRLRATTGQHEAVGATVALAGPNGPRQGQVLSRGAGFVSCQAPELVFGLGGAKSASISVHWPGGKTEVFGPIEKNTRVLLTEGENSFETIAPESRPLPDPLPPGLRVDEGDVLTELTVLNAGGARETLNLVELADGKPLYVNFWATYCAPCVQEIPVLQKLVDAGNAAVLGISVDPTENDAERSEVQALLSSRGGEFPGYFVDPDPESDLGQLIDLERLPIPTTLVLSPEGRVESILRGPLAD